MFYYGITNFVVYVYIAMNEGMGPVWAIQKSALYIVVCSLPVLVMQDIINLSEFEICQVNVRGSRSFPVGPEPSHLPVGQVGLGGPIVIGWMYFNRK